MIFIRPKKKFLGQENKNSFPRKKILNRILDLKLLNEFACTWKCLQMLENKKNIYF